MTTPLPFAGFVNAPLERSPELPELPEQLTYWDDYEEVYRVIRDVRTTRSLGVWDDGELHRFALDECDDFERGAILLIVEHMFAVLSSTSVVEWLSTFRTLSRRAENRFLKRLAALSPSEIRPVWVASLLQDLKNPSEGNCLRKILHVYCDLRIGDWAPSYKSIVKSLPSPKSDPFAVVKAGECFIPAAMQQLIYDFLDELAEASARDQANLDDLRSAIAIILVDQHALRPGIISKIKYRDVRAFESGAVHVTFRRNKKPKDGRRREATRRIKRSWSPIFLAYNRLRVRDGLATPTSKYLDLVPREISRMIADRLQELTNERWTATDARHTAAQRQVDSGATALQLAEFMGHEGTFVGNVYFDQSRTQADLVNEALALSPIYSALPGIYKSRTIDKAALVGLEEDHQIGAVPHGIPISGIGSCTLGQSICSKNPVLSCYTCRRLMAVSDPLVHEGVVESLRPVVKAFYKAGRGDSRNPTYAQLRTVMHAAAAVSRELKTGEGR